MPRKPKQAPAELRDPLVSALTEKYGDTDKTVADSVYDIVDLVVATLNPLIRAALFREVAHRLPQETKTGALWESVSTLNDWADEAEGRKPAKVVENQRYEVVTADDKRIGDAYDTLDEAAVVSQRQGGEVRPIEE